MQARHAVRLGQKQTSQKVTAQLLDKAPGIVPDRAVICIDENKRQRRKRLNSGQASAKDSSQGNELIQRVPKTEEQHYFESGSAVTGPTTHLIV